MTNWPHHPVVYEINTWVWLAELSREAGQQVTLGSVPAAELERLAGCGFDGVWLMGIWERSPASRAVARDHPDLQGEYRRALPDYTRDDVVGSPYSVLGYRADPALGGDDGLAALRSRLREHGLRLILDFVPNHLAVDHAWVDEYPERLVHGSEGSLEAEPSNYFASEAGGTRRVFAHGRDPNFAGWTDTAQLDYRRPETRRAVADVLLEVAGRCDGVRCDMAMLVNRDVFLRTWGGEFVPAWAEFWPAAITDIRARHPGFLLLAEAYWGLEWELQQLGFDYTYDKTLYDTLVGGNVNALRQHLEAGLEYQSRLARFVENHDEERAATAFGSDRSRAAAALALTLPGLRLLHEGQFEGRRTKLPVQLSRRPQEDADPATESLYRRLLECLRSPVFHDGAWQRVAPHEAAGGGQSHGNIMAHLWTSDEECRLVAANMSADSARCYLSLALPGGPDREWRLVDSLGDVQLTQHAGELVRPGLHLDLVGYGYRLFEMRPG